MDAESLSQQMKALKKKAREARAAGKHVIAREFAGGASRLWRKVRKLMPRVTKKTDA